MGGGVSPQLSAWTSVNLQFPAGSMPFHASQPLAPAAHSWKALPLHTLRHRLILQKDICPLPDFSTDYLSFPSLNVFICKMEKKKKSLPHCVIVGVQ